MQIRGQPAAPAGEDTLRIWGASPRPIAPAGESRKGAGHRTYILIDSRKVLPESVSRGTGVGCSVSPCRQPAPGPLGEQYPACRTQCFQSQDSVALLRLWLDLIINPEIVSLARPTWRKLSYLNQEQSASHPHGCSEARTTELLPCWA